MVTPSPFAAPVAPAPVAQEYPPNIPKVEATASSNIPSALYPAQPADKDFNKGVYTQISSGEEFALAVVDNDPLGRTHKAKNSLHYWEGTAAEFRQQFDVKDNDKNAPKDGDK